jgi:hypothetical protein
VRVRTRRPYALSSFNACVQPISVSKSDLTSIYTIERLARLGHSESVASVHASINEWSNQDRSSPFANVLSFAGRLSRSRSGLSRADSDVSGSLLSKQKHLSRDGSAASLMHEGSRSALQQPETEVTEFANPSSSQWIQSVAAPHLLSSAFRAGSLNAPELSTAASRIDDDTGLGHWQAAPAESGSSLVSGRRPQTPGIDILLGLAGATSTRQLSTVPEGDDSGSDESPAILQPSSSSLSASDHHGVTATGSITHAASGIAASVADSDQYEHPSPSRSGTPQFVGYDGPATRSHGTDASIFVQKTSGTGTDRMKRSSNGSLAIRVGHGAVSPSHSSDDSEITNFRHDSAGFVAGIPAGVSSEEFQLFAQQVRDSKLHKNQQVTRLLTRFVAMPARCCAGSIFAPQAPPRTAAAEQTG